MSTTNTGPSPADIGVIGLGVMGENLALNMEDDRFRVALWNRKGAKVADVIQRAGPNRRLIGTRTLEDLAAALGRPRRILLLIKAGAPVDEMLEELAPLLSPDDVVIDMKHFAEITRLAMVGERRNGSTAWRRSASRS